MLIRVINVKKGVKHVQILELVLHVVLDILLMVLNVNKHVLVVNMEMMRIQIIQFVSLVILLVKPVMDL